MSFNVCYTLEEDNIDLTPHWREAQVAAIVDTRKDFSCTLVLNVQPRLGVTGKEIEIEVGVPYEAIRQLSQTLKYTSKQMKDVELNDEGLSKMKDAWNNGETPKTWTDYVLSHTKHVESHSKNDKTPCISPGQLTNAVS